MNRDSIHVLIDADSTRVLELTPYAFSQLLAGQAVGAPKAELVSAQDVWAMPAEQVIADSTLEGRINEFVTSIAEKYARNEQVTREGVEYIEGRYFPAVVALSMDKRSDLLAQAGGQLAAAQRTPEHESDQELGPRDYGSCGLPSAPRHVGAGGPAECG